jgi:hypothetical protein
MNAHDLDGVLRGLSRSLSRHELELSQLVLQFHRADGWRQLGYASEAQYASERLGMSRSSFVARRALALRLEKLPRVAEALGAGQLGVEAALQAVRVAAPGTEAAWVERAQQRTIKHLREEVAAALVAVRLSGKADCRRPWMWRWLPFTSWSRPWSADGPVNRGLPMMSPSNAKGPPVWESRGPRRGRRGW